MMEANSRLLKSRPESPLIVFNEAVHFISLIRCQDTILYKGEHVSFASLKNIRQTK